MTFERACLQAFFRAGVLAAEELHALRLVAPRYGETDEARLLGLAFAVRAPRLGHAGAELSRVRAAFEAELALRSPEDASSPALPWPEDAAQFRAHVFSSPMVSREPRDPETQDRPFVVVERASSEPLLCTRRMYELQRRIASELVARAGRPFEDSELPDDLDARIASFFRAPGSDDRESFEAARLAARSRLAIVTGGPGTGKTFLVARLLAALHATARTKRPLSVALAAPTGKAAVRMLEALGDALAGVELEPRVRSALHELEARTVHRLLGIGSHGTPRHHAGRPLAADVVVVDEVSMVDLFLMQRLLDATSPDARLVLLGDRDQLASVDAGSVLGDLVRDVLEGRPEATLRGNVAELTRSRRFEDAPEVAAVAAALRGSSDARLDEVLRRMAGEPMVPSRASVIDHLGAPVAPRDGVLPRPSEAELHALAAPYLEGFALRGSRRPSELAPGYAALLARGLDARGAPTEGLRDLALQRAILDAFEGYRVLAAHRRGPCGVEALERALARRVRERLLAEREAGAELPQSGPHWLGRALLVTENAYDVELMNGDIGLVLVDGEGKLTAAFPAPRSETGVRHVALSRLPAHEGAFAMTVHKAQGSQYERVAFVLAGRASPIQTRELVYTAVTRAKDQFAWLGSSDELRDALSRRVVRASALAELLAGR
ncbi:MAG: exodeoxyribonuclease V subunit alpha [Deltaproteobacteria bacterium]|nr:exodeoxyribonuclease V subunit alpha [Deltaproteobacteria bacterium]